MVTHAHTHFSQLPFLFCKVTFRPTAATNLTFWLGISAFRLAACSIAYLFIPFLFLSNIWTMNLLPRMGLISWPILFLRALTSQLHHCRNEMALTRWAAGGGRRSRCGWKTASADTDGKLTCTTSDLFEELVWGTGEALARRDPFNISTPGSKQVATFINRHTPSSNIQPPLTFSPTGPNPGGRHTESSQSSSNT